MNKAFREILSSHAASASAASRAIADIKHAGLRGQMREVLVEKFLTPLLPPTLGIGHGEIISYTGGHSNEQDIVLYDKALVPPALIGNTASGLFPIDAVIYTIEVKSQLTATELKKAHRSAKKLNSMSYLPNPAKTCEKAIPCLFAFASNLSRTGWGEVERYKRVYSGQPALRAICVVDQGYWFWSERREWEEGYVSKQRFKFAEMLDFVSTIHATFERIKSTGTKSLNPYFCDSK